MSVPTTYLTRRCSKSVTLVCTYTSSPRSLVCTVLVRVTHQSNVCLPHQGRGGQRKCSLCAILGHTGCSSNVTSVLFTSFTCSHGLRMQAFVHVGVCVCFYSPQIHASLDCPLHNNNLLPAIANEWSHLGRASQSIVWGICL